MTATVPLAATLNDTSAAAAVLARGERRWEIIIDRDNKGDGGGGCNRRTGVPFGRNWRLWQLLRRHHRTVTGVKFVTCVDWSNHRTNDDMKLRSEFFRNADVDAMRKSEERLNEKRDVLRRTGGGDGALMHARHRHRPAPFLTVIPHVGPRGSGCDDDHGISLYPVNALLNLGLDAVAISVLDGCRSDTVRRSERGDS